MTAPRFNHLGIIARLVFGQVLVLALWNPSGRSWWHWLTGPGGDRGLPLLVGLVLVPLTLSLLWFAWRALRPLGVVAVVAACAVIGELLGAAGLPPPATVEAWLLGAQLTLGAVLGVGMAIPPLEARLTGIHHVHEIGH